MVAVLCSRVSQSFLRRQYTWMDNARMDYVDELQDFDVPQEFDLYVDGMLLLLGDSDPFVRQTAAFGLSNTLRKLPKLFADEVIEAVLDVCNPAETAKAWNGALTALADIVRQRLVLAARLPEVGAVVVQALQNRFGRLGQTCGTRPASACGPSPGPTPARRSA